MKLFTLSFLSVCIAGGLLIGCTGAGSGAMGGPDQQALHKAARAIAREEGLISPAELADRLIAEHDAPVLVDLREPQQFRAGHIRGSRNADIPGLFTGEGRAQLADGPQLVLVSERGVTAAQTAALLGMTGVTALALDGGFDAWRRYLDPGQGPAADVDEARARDMAKRQAAACWFEGDYVAAAGLTVKTASGPVGQGGGYVPPLEPVGAPAEAPAADPLGLGLGLGLGPEDTGAQGPALKLRIGEGC